MNEHTGEHADLDRLEFAEERLPPRVVCGRKNECLGLHCAEYLSYMHKRDAHVHMRS
jgi:hypothetical protein